MTRKALIPESDFVRLCHESKSITEIAKKRDSYRVLKNISLENNDQPQALVFYAKEMQYHKKLTLESRCHKKDFKRFFIKDILKNLILLKNSKSLISNQWNWS